jgi:transcriptional regulator with XRE-family HTH domain
MDVGDDAHTIGRRVRQIRHARGKSLRVVAALAGISASHLHRIETGQRALDSRAQPWRWPTRYKFPPQS